MERIWQQQYPNGIATEIEKPEHSSLTHLYKDSCEKYNSKVAFSCLNTSLSYAELYMYSSRFASYLQHKLQLTPGDKIGIMLPNLLQHPIVMFGSLQAGLTIVNINPLEKSEILAHELSDSDCKAIVVLENFAAELEKALPKTKIEHVIIAKIGDLFSFPKNIIANFTMRYIKLAVKKHHVKFPIALSEIIYNSDLAAVESSMTDINSIAYIQYTSGTTAKPKGVILTHANILANISQARSWISSDMKDANEIIITALPLYHIFSLTANCWVYFSKGANNFLIPNPRDIKGFIKQIKSLKFTAITGVNTLFHGLLSHREFSNVDFSKLKITLGGGMAVNKTIAQSWSSVTNCHITQAYGLTETSPAATINPIDFEFNGSIGLPLPSTDICIKDQEGNEVEFGAHGEICIKGPQVTSGYWRNEAATKAAIKHGYLHTGDIGYMDKHGFIYIVDRLKDMIIVSGFNVPAIEVEDCILQLEQVLEVAVVGSEDEHQGESIVAHIVLKPKTKLTESEIISYCHKKIAAYKVPHYVVLELELPKNNLGKIMKRKLRDKNSTNLHGAHK
ncbi:MAG: AMP-binding protein [Legionellales bacterium]|nr:AMP-binding protein [Legionellales bacterium]